MIPILAAVLWSMAAAVLAPDTAFGRTMREVLVDGAVRLLSRGAIALCAKVAVLVALAGFAMFAPEVIVLVGGVADFALIMEVAALVTMTSGAIRLRTGVALLARTARAALRAVVPAGRVAGRASRARRTRPVRPVRPDNDDEPAGWAFALAA